MKIFSKIVFLTSDFPSMHLVLHTGIRDVKAFGNEFQSRRICDFVKNSVDHIYQ